MFALVDAVAFYASAEKVFDPTIRKRPVVVLTNNDGCICAVSPEARKLNIPKFEPYFKLKNYLNQHNVVVRSSNYELYADLSSRMMNVISRFSDNQHIYSIDESFLQFTGFKSIINDWHQYGQDIRLAVWRETKLPVGVGFGITPTLAKAANHAAKKLDGFNGVAVIDDPISAKAILQRMAVTDVWGIGGRLGKKLNLMRINTAWDLAQQSPKHMRKQFSVVVERTIEELNGKTCLAWDEVKQDKQEIFSTRSFGERITNISDLRAALVTHSSIVSRKLRQQASLTKRLVIFAHSSIHEDNFYKRSFLYDFSVPTNDSRVMANAVSEVLPQIFSNGVRFYKAGIGAFELVTEQYMQPDLFTPSKDNKLLMSSIDSINKIFGKGTIRLASEQQSQRWSMKREFLSRRYTTRWSDIPVISC
ncbi:DNA polymerase V subunit UmuC [Pseudoalteromonas sp. S201]|uniref:Y-family DNA polymerase n=1 Tax=Pseudoalteromonas sp. S201 TaxID=579519 RepID=UPI00110CB440|nr:Y-family DNA polymerase [Pseudoalteromonas sp. S201]TMS92352.1 DNA polymerase V subunit UmuC [Pseudoalteromonas sp. S201]